MISLGFYLPRVIKVREITCQNQYGHYNQDLKEDLEKARGLDLISAWGLVKETLSKNLLVKDYSIQFKLPASLEVYFIERKAKFALANRLTEQTALIDKQGRVITLSDSTALPYILTDQQLLSPGEKVENNILFSLEILFDIYSSYQVKTAYLLRDGLLIELDRGITVVFPQEGDKQILLGSLSLILNQLNSADVNSKIESIDVNKATVDLRFKNPVIR